LAVAAVEHILLDLDLLVLPVVLVVVVVGKELLVALELADKAMLAEHLLEILQVLIHLLVVAELAELAVVVMVIVAHLETEELE
jgi:hypothetical protein